MVKLRLRRIGNRNRPVYRVVVADQRLPRDGRFIEEIGTYNPLQKDNNYRLDLDRVDYWLGVGAQASDTVASFIKKARKAADESPAEAVTETPAPVEEAAPAPVEEAAPAPVEEAAPVAESKNSEE
ncbi:MAG: 30S ribosomal protein S16 [Limisphaerales bacterium]|tara:strand:- start:629 stop:1006 length:378 start_codon:yes stop_codon:yes gene_type:complete